MITKKKYIITIALCIVLSAAICGVAVWLLTGGYAAFMPKSVATLPQDPPESEDELALISRSEKFWTAMENADEAGMRAVASSECVFVHIGMTCGLDAEIEAYTSGAFRPASIVFNGKNVNVYGDTGIVLTDCDYALSIGGIPTSHHFAVTEVFARIDGAWRLVQFSFTALTA